MGHKKPAYRKLYDELRDEILRGAWGYGARLPSRRQLAQERGLSVVTVEHSFELLCQEGYAEARPRSGYFVTYRDGDGFVSVGSPSPRPVTEVKPEGGGFSFPLLAKVTRRVLTDYGEAVLERSPGSGCDVLRTALARYLDRSRGMPVKPEQLVIGAGAEYLYGLIVEMLGRERGYAIEVPSYAKIEQVYQAKGVVCDRLPLGPDGIQSEALWSTSADVLHITPYRSYPSGVTASASRRREYLRWAAIGNRVIVEDDFESEFSLLRKPEETVFSRSDRANVIYLNTFTRTLSPAIRVGYMVLPEPMIKRFEARTGFYSCTVPTLIQLVLAEILDCGDFERHINRIRRRIRREQGRD